MMERHMASHPSVTPCDVSAPCRHIVTSRHTPLRGVTDVTCDAGPGIIDFADEFGRTADQAISVENIKTPCHFHDIDLRYTRCHLQVGEAPSAPPNSLGADRGRDTYVEW